MAKLLTLPAGRRAKWVVAGLWLLVVAASLGLNLPGKYADAENNESTTFLPGDAESTEVLGITDRLQGGEQAPIVIVYRRESGLTAADRARVAAEVASSTTRSGSIAAASTAPSRRSARRSRRARATRRCSWGASRATARQTRSSTRSTTSAVA
jgi:hypothetical protein